MFNYVLPESEVLPKAISLAREIIDNTSPMSVIFCKALLSRGAAETEPVGAHMNESKCVNWMGTNADFREGVLSFIEVCWKFS